MVGQNLQGRHSELRAEADFEINQKAEREIETVLEHLSSQSELMLEILRRIERLDQSRAGRAARASCCPLVPRRSASRGSSPSGRPGSRRPAWRISSRVFMTNGPYCCTTGSPIGRPPQQQDVERAGAAVLLCGALDPQRIAGAVHRELA